MTSHSREVGKKARTDCGPSHRGHSLHNFKWKSAILARPFGKKRFTGGKTLSKHFHDLTEAREWIFGDAASEKAKPGGIIELKTLHGQSPFAALSASQISEAANAFKRIEKWGLSLTAALDLAERYKAPEMGLLSVADAIAQCIEEKEKLKRAPTTLYDLKSRWKRFAAFLPESKKAAIHTINRSDIERFIKTCSLSPVGQRNMVRGLSSFFSWAVSAKMVSINPTADWDFSEAKKELARDREPRILTIEEVEKILRIATDGCATPMTIAEQEIMRMLCARFSLSLNFLRRETAFALAIPFSFWRELLPEY